MNPVLATRDLRRSFGALEVTAGVDLALMPGARHALIGPNGAGKSTLINLLTGTLRPSGGQVLLEGRDITGLPAAARVARGLSRTFQINTLFPLLTPLEAVLLAVCRRTGILARPLRRLAGCGPEIDEAHDLVCRFGLEAVCDRPTAELAYGQQRLLEIALALAARPRVLLLDEPAAGVPARESAILMAAIAGLPRDVAVLFIEHDMELVFRFAERITVLVAGRILREGLPDQIANDAEVRRVYLGEDDE
jgi:ABC-type branched-subunit amino acid transport system ATPase component